MSSNILRLARVHLKGSLGISEGFASSDDRKWKKSLGLLATYVIVGIAIIVLVTLVSNALVMLGQTTQIPALVAVFAAVFIFILNVFRSGATVFDLKLFEAEVALPVTSTQIVASRFLELYVTNLMIALVVMVPGLIVCGMNLIIAPIFIVAAIVGVLLTPLIPLTISTAIGAVLYAISAHMRHRKLIIVILGLALMVTAFLLYFTFMFGNGGSSLPSNLADLLSANFSALTGWYVPATLFTEGLMGGILSFMCYVGISVGLYVILLFLVSWKYLPICQAMQIRDARHNYVMHDQVAVPRKKSLFKREFKRYTSSTTYVFNTLFGYILMIVFAIFILSTGGTAGLEAKFGNMDAMKMLCPLVIGGLAALSSTTCASISIEGKNWWITQTLPVTAKEIFSTKLKVNYAVALPFYLISEIILIIALQPNVLEAIAILLLPLVYIYFMSVFGLRVAVRHPNFTWKSESEAVKQGVGLLLSILIALGTLIIAFILVFVGTGTQLWWAAPLILCGFSLIILALGIVLHCTLNKRQLIDIV
ncbi:MAG TPA: hypothetical protein O0X27_00460 [Methanocorpusculum sp.]|nr:hypothetical protein [Methanocorpusculum sp.]